MERARPNSQSIERRQHPHSRASEALLALSPAHHCLLLQMSKPPTVFALFRPQPPQAEKQNFREYAFDYGAFDLEAPKRQALFAPTRVHRSSLCVEAGLFCFDLSATLAILIYALLSLVQFRLVSNPEWQIIMAILLTLVTLRWYLALDFKNPCLELLFACGLVVEGIGLFCLIHTFASHGR
uniref:Uncharacterized protein n=1 Tax=Steinernema glaseri TaxID=37863 RepID=A0A1I8AM49_9BILA